MKISDVIKELQKLKDENGDIDVCWASLHHHFSVDELKLVDFGDHKFVQVN